MHEFESVLDGAKGLLVETIKLLNTLNINYVIIGGWSPLLRNDTDITHPGTRDVDILFLEASQRNELGEVIKLFIDNGFLISAKHDFQLFKTINVCGKELVYHVDLLHPLEASAKSDLFVDHLDLGIPVNKLYQDVKGTHVKSIALEYSKFIFDGYFKIFSMQYLDTKGIKTEINFPLIDESGLILSKCISVSSPKRQRDAFDIYLAFKQTNLEETKNKLKTAYQQNIQLKIALNKLLEYLIESSEIFDKNVISYLCKCGSEISDLLPSQYVKIHLQEILEKENN